MAMAEDADKADIPDGMPIPDELARREERLQKISEARTKIEARARERFEREQTEYQSKLAAMKRKATGKKAGGKAPEPPAGGPKPTDQINPAPVEAMGIFRRRRARRSTPSANTRPNRCSGSSNPSSDSVGFCSVVWRMCSASGAS
jgi:hypothetical protein